jgi:hypothetical protein
MRPSAAVFALLLFACAVIGCVRRVSEDEAYAALECAMRSEMAASAAAKRNTRAIASSASVIGSTAGRAASWHGAWAPWGLSSLLGSMRALPSWAVCDQVLAEGAPVRGALSDLANM